MDGIEMVLREEAESERQKTEDCMRESLEMHAIKREIAVYSTMYIENSRYMKENEN